MGFAWMPDNSAGAFGDSYRDKQRVGRRDYSKYGGRAGARAPQGRHALSHSPRRRLASFGSVSLVPLGRSRGTPPANPANGDYRGAGRGAHAARLPVVPRRTSGSGSERWRRWA
jgi:hypothetical protein